MLLSTVLSFSLAALPFLVGAVPVSLNSPRTGRPISIPLRKHVNHLNRDGTVNNEKLEVSLRRTEAKFEHKLRMYERNTDRLHPNTFRQGHSNERRIFVSDSLTNHGDLLWTGTVLVGTPARAFNLVVDTSQSETFIDGVNCLGCDTQNVYDINFSSTAVSDRINQTVTFGPGLTSLVTGILVKDDVFVAGFKATHSFIVGTELDPTFLPPSFPADGLIGFGFGGGSTTLGTASFIEDVIGQGQLNGAQAVFGMTFDDSTPELVMGGTDFTKFSGSLTLVSVVSSTDWQIPINSIDVNGNEVSLTIKEAIIDTSSPFVSGDYDTISSIYSNIPGSAPIPNSGQWTIPCDTNVPITITIGSVPFTVSPPSYNIGPIIGSDNLCTGGFATVDITTLQLGTVFLRNVYTNFDIENRLVGFAPIGS